VRACDHSGKLCLYVIKVILFSHRVIVQNCEKQFGRSEIIAVIKKKNLFLAAPAIYFKQDKKT
jgi:hypothetical protein